MSAQERQSEASVEKNASFFRDNLESYSSNIELLDTYRTIRKFTNEPLQGIDRLLDIGNGGTFDYDVRLVREVVAVDLFLEGVPSSAFPPNVTAKNGSALDLPEPDASFDGVIMSMLIHHLIGKTVQDSASNMSRAIAEAFRVLKPGGKLIIIESCVPRWFYDFEKIVFPLACKFIGLTMKHPATLQFPAQNVLDVLRQHTSVVETVAIPKGRWVLQFGFKVPSVLTPAMPYRFVACKEQP